MKKIHNAVIISDLHCICRLGLFPARLALRLDGGGTYNASRLQRTVWSWWEHFWNAWVPEATRGEPYSVIFNGDTVDGGGHHGNTTHISANEDDQERLVLAVVEPVIKRAARAYFVRGTEVHVGAGGVNEERLARQLAEKHPGKIVPTSEGAYSHWHLRLRLGYALLDVAHHIGTTGTMAYETSAILKELEQTYVDAARWGEEPPDVVVRSHRHRYAEARLRIKKAQHGKARQGFASSCTTPGWQLKTPFVHRIPGGRVARPQFGGVLVRCGDEEVYTRAYVESIQETPILEA